MSLSKIVIGADTRSALYAFLKDYYFLPTGPGPIFYKKMPVRLLGSDRQDYSWSRLCICMALQGKLLSYNKIANINISENILKISDENKVYKHEFKECLIFDSSGIQLENVIVSAAPDTYLVYDDFELSCLGGKHKYLKPKLYPNAIGKEIHYYSSDRVDGAKYVTDCVVESVLSKEQLTDFNYSDTMVRFAVERHLTEIGVLGNFMNLYKSGQPKYRKPKVVHKNRVVYKKDNCKYKNSQAVKFLNLSLEEVLSAAGSSRS